MKIKDCIALVTGGASGLGEGTVRNIVAQGGKAAILDIAEGNANSLIKEFGDRVIFAKTNVTDEASVRAAVAQAVDAFGSITAVINCAGVADAQKVISKKGPHDLALFQKVVSINLIGTFNVVRLAVEKMAANDANEEGERGVIINTASVAAFDGQIGQAAYAASKGGIVSMTLPLARELAAHGIRVFTIAPGLFETPMFKGLPDEAIKNLGKMAPFPQRLGYPEEYSLMVESILTNPMLNGSVVRLDAAIRMQAR